MIEDAANLKIALRDIDHKIELGVKGLWKNMEAVFGEIVEENKDIKKLRKKSFKTIRVKRTSRQKWK